ncbi:MAG: type II toxin-antitoxin system HicB family antitoxin [Sedimenticola sp.]
MKLMQYKGFYGSIEASVEDGCLYGKLEFIDPLVNYEGDTVHALETAFHEAVNDYIQTCQTLNVEPQKPYRGSFNVRIGRGLHRAAVIAAKQRNMNLNELVTQAIKRELG